MLPQLKNCINFHFTQYQRRQELSPRRSEQKYLEAEAEFLLALNQSFSRMFRNSLWLIPSTLKLLRIMKTGISLSSGKTIGLFKSLRP